MRLIKESQRKTPKVSLILADWSVRESFHILDYLSRQTVDRDDFEVIIVEFYSRVSDAAEQYRDQIDTWVTLDTPEGCYYHKHLMYNAGLLLARAEIVMIGDADAMVKPSFIASILAAFQRDPNAVFHIDQFRNGRQDLYPFRHPSFEDVEGEGVMNRSGTVTTGLADRVDPIHSRNYGACMCARRDDLIAIGGADMHLDFLGHICGPYDMTFRLVNLGRHETWSDTEFTYHTWHPGQAGEDNYLGPHDGRHMSSTSLQALTTGRVMPLDENPAIAAVRQGRLAPHDALSLLFDPRLAASWSHDTLDRVHRVVWPVAGRHWVASHRGAKIWQDGTAFSVEWQEPGGFADLPATAVADQDAARAAIDRGLPPAAARTMAAIRAVTGGMRLVGLGLRLLGRIARGRFSLNRFRRTRGLSRGVREQAVLGSALDNVVSVLLQRGRKGVATGTIIVAARTEYLALLLGIALGILPKARVISCAAGWILPECLDSTAPILLQSTVYARGYGFLGSPSLREKMIIV